MSKAIIRVKRSLTDDPINTLVVNCKKRKVEDSTTSEDTDSEDLSRVFEFAGTVENANDVFQHMKSNTKPEVEHKFRRNHLDIISKLRNEQQASSKTNRYKIVNHFRSLDADDVASPDIDYTIVDVVTSETDTEEAASNGSEVSSQFVYDYYYTDSDAMYDEVMCNYLSVCPLSNDRLEVFNKYNDSASEDSEDSNAENYFANDYPDESDVESNQDEEHSEINDALHKLIIDRDLSTDDSDDNVYGNPRAVALDHSYYEDYDDSITP